MFIKLLRAQKKSSYEKLLTGQKFETSDFFVKTFLTLFNGFIGWIENLKDYFQD